MFFNNRIILEVPLASVTLALGIYSEQQKWNPVAILQCNNLRPAIQVNISSCVHTHSGKICDFYQQIC